MLVALSKRKRFSTRAAGGVDFQRTGFGGNNAWRLPREELRLLSMPLRFDRFQIPKCFTVPCGTDCFIRIFLSSKMSFFPEHDLIASAVDVSSDNIALVFDDSDSVSVIVGAQILACAAAIFAFSAQMHCRRRRHIGYLICKRANRNICRAEAGDRTGLHPRS
jgi:hypothetical protein